ncbi:hypothetical protein H1C71_015089 [Ictidomys tridecemlineatus]|nr:hypothetical protein H1C71_015089 [Ictidomys tridecemlineatus]KAG3260226.1 hypothetical protein H1C71_015089 [Ictidomys tridecemlineatus]KAG3260227.1 hypothetical protein H1C71_015089 [Ictidomys tridecemlineatus]
MGPSPLPTQLLRALCQSWWGLAATPPSGTAVRVMLEALSLLCLQWWWHLATVCSRWGPTAAVWLELICTCSLALRASLGSSLCGARHWVLSAHLPACVFQSWGQFSLGLISSVGL